jgi:hypothetical protein
MFHLFLQLFCFAYFFAVVVGNNYIAPLGFLFPILLRINVYNNNNNNNNNALMCGGGWGRESGLRRCDAVETKATFAASNVTELRKMQHSLILLHVLNSKLSQALPQTNASTHPYNNTATTVGNSACAAEKHC